MQRERVTITIEPELLIAIDETINKQSIRNRSHAIESLIKKGLDLDSLKQAFIFFREGWTLENLTLLLHSLKQVGIEQIYVCNQSTQPIENLEQFKAFQIEEIPSSFGSGGALLLKKDKIQHQFITAILNDSYQPNTNLLGGHSFHLIHKPLCTHFITPTTLSEMSWSGIDIVEPEAINYISMGASEIDQSLFPVLIKENKLKTYVS